MIDWRKAWASACKAATFRESACTTVGAQPHATSCERVPERGAMQLTGHKTRSVFDRYDIVAEDDLRSGVDQLATYVEQQQIETRVIPQAKTAG